MDVCRRLVEHPFFSVCIPQHNRTSFLVEVCRSLDRQRERDFEVCISDDCSTDGRDAELLGALHASGLSFVYRRLPQNARYDGNLRSAIGLATGRYCFLLGNDDVLKSTTTLDQLRQAIETAPEVQVVFTNFEDYASGQVTRRVRRPGVIGAGADVAARCFRKFSFVSGVVLKTDAAQSAATTRWDGSEMYQMYIGCRLIAAGGLLLESDIVAVRKDLQIPGEAVDSYASKPAPDLRGVPVLSLPVGRIVQLVVAAIDPYAGVRRTRILANITGQYFGLLYPFWIFEYRRVRSWRFAAGVCRGMAPRHTLAGVNVSRAGRAWARVLYAATTIAGLTLPLWVLDHLRRPARTVASTIGDWRATASRP